MSATPEQLEAMRGLAGMMRLGDRILETDALFDRLARDGFVVHDLLATSDCPDGADAKEYANLWLSGFLAALHAARLKDHELAASALVGCVATMFSVLKVAREKWDDEN